MLSLFLNLIFSALIVQYDEREREWEFKGDVCMTLKASKS